MYILPQIHKDPAPWKPPYIMAPGRPTVCDCGSDTDIIADYIEFFLNPLSIKHPVYIKDTYHFIDIIKGIRVPTDSFLFSLDVDSFYANIETQAGLMVSRQMFDHYPDPSRPDDELLTLLDINLTRNNFLFDQKYFLQVKGTAMGKSWPAAQTPLLGGNVG